MNAGQSIRQAITLDPLLPALVAEAATIGEGFIGFFFDDVTESWDFWTANTADATATNCYYTPAECRALLVERGFAELAQDHRAKSA